MRSNRFEYILLPLRYAKLMLKANYKPKMWCTIFVWMLVNTIESMYYRIIYYLHCNYSLRIVRILVGKIALSYRWNWSCINFLTDINWNYDSIVIIILFSVVQVLDSKNDCDLNMKKELWMKPQTKEAIFHFCIVFSSVD